MVTAIVSDLHLGALGESDVARAPARRERLLHALAGADRVVLLGDVLELRHRPLAELLELVRPFFEEVGNVAAGRSVLIVPGNHDHALAEPWLARLRLEGRTLDPEGVWPVDPGDGPAGRLAGWMPDAQVTLAYPGVRLRPDVYATHGHYLDLHLTVPRLESIGASAMGCVTGRTGSATPPPTMRPSWPRCTRSLPVPAEGASPVALQRGGRTSREVWRRVNGNGRLGRLLLGRVTIPAAVAVLNRAGLGPFRPSDRPRSCGDRACSPWAACRRGAGPGRRARGVRPYPPPRPCSPTTIGPSGRPSRASGSGTGQLVFTSRPSSAVRTTGARTGPAQCSCSTKRVLRDSRTCCATDSRAHRPPSGAVESLYVSRDLPQTGDMVAVLEPNLNSLSPTSSPGEDELRIETRASVSKRERAAARARADLAEIWRCIDAAGAGEGCALVLEGPEGIGKHALLTAAVDHAQRAGYATLTARAGERESDLPWGVVRGLFEPELATVARAERRKLLSDAAGLAKIALRPGPPDAGPRRADALGAALHGLYWLTANMAARRPVLLAIDDAHWADKPSLRWLGIWWRAWKASRCWF